MIYRHFPLTSIHENAVLAAEAAEAAGTQGLFWEFHDALYARQTDFNAAADPLEFLAEIAAEVGGDGDALKAEVESGVHTEYVELSLQEAANLALPGTPAIFVNGELLQGAPPVEAWGGYIDSLRIMSDLEDRQYEAPPELTIDESVIYVATVEMESGDQFVMELYPSSAPLTVNNFVFLANEGWFDGVTFHRVLPGFVAQTGDPTGTGLGGPGYQIPNEVDPQLTHAEVGMVAMANSGPDTNGSQWYVTLGDAAFLDGGYTIFGRVVDGLDVVQGITPRDPSTNPNAPAGDTIVSVEITEK